MRLDAATTKTVVDAALDAGITYFDTAESYGDGRSEEFLGAAMVGRRESALVATKWGHTGTLRDGDRGGDPAVIRRSLDASLKRLGTDYVDPYQLPRPDPQTPMDETLGALGELVAEGKVRAIGCTAFAAVELDEATAAASRLGLQTYASVQNHFSLLTRTPERDRVLDVCARDAIAFVPFFPLESGLLAGRYRAGEALPPDSRLANWGERSKAFIDDAKLQTVAGSDGWAVEREHTLLELSMGWLTSNPFVATVIAGRHRPPRSQPTWLRPTGR